MSLLKKLAGETAIYGISHILSRVLLYVVFAGYFTRKFGTSEYGIYTDVYSYATVLLTILVFRMDTAFFRFGSKENIQKTFNTGFIAILMFCLIILLFLLPNVQSIASWLTYNDSPHYIRWFAYILALDAVAALIFARLRLESRPMRFMFYKLSNVFITIIAVLVFLEVLPRYFPEGYEVVNSYFGITRSVDFVFLANLIASGAVLFMMIPEMKSFRFAFDKALFKKMGWYALPLVFVGIAGNINQAFAAPLQKYFLGNDVLDNLSNVGIYAAAAKLAVLLNLFTTAFNYAAEPFFFKNAEAKNSKEVYSKVALAFTLVACLAVLGIVFYIDIFMLIVGEQFRSAIYVVPILLFANVFLGLYYNVSIWYKLKDKTYVGAVISFVGVFITIVLSIALLPSIGKIASAWAALSCYVVMVAIGYFVGQRYYPIRYPVGKILGYIGLTAIGTLFALWLRTLGLSTFIYISIVTSLLFLYVFVVYRREWSTMIKDN